MTAYKTGNACYKNLHFLLFISISEVSIMKETRGESTSMDVRDFLILMSSNVEWGIELIQQRQHSVSLGYNGIVNAPVQPE